MISKGSATDSDSSDAFCTRVTRHIKRLLCFDFFSYGAAGDRRLLCALRLGANISNGTKQQKQAASERKNIGDLKQIRKETQLSKIIRSYSLTCQCI